MPADYVAYNANLYWKAFFPALPHRYSLLAHIVSLYPPKIYSAIVY